MQSLQHGELFSHNKRSMIRQHHTARTNDDPLSRPCEVGNEHRRGRASHARHVVMFSNPEAMIITLLRALSKGRGLR